MDNTTSTIFTPQVIKLICAASCTIPLAIVAMSLGKMFSALMVAMGTNPTVIDKGQTLVITTAALLEVVGLLILVIAMLILFQ